MRAQESERVQEKDGCFRRRLLGNRRTHRHPSTRGLRLLTGVSARKNHAQRHPFVDRRRHQLGDAEEHHARPCSTVSSTSVHGSKSFTPSSMDDVASACSSRSSASSRCLDTDVSIGWKLEATRRSANRVARGRCRPPAPTPPDVPFGIRRFMKRTQGVETSPEGSRNPCLGLVAAPPG